MTFVTMGLLIAGAVAMAVPVLIHLLSRQRRRPIEWAAMRFLLEALRKHRRRLQIEQLLLLAVRCLILLLLGAALARPFLESAGLLEGGGARVVYLVIDNGLASGVRGDTERPQRTALAASIDTAVQIVESLGPGDRVGVITAARPAMGVVVPPSGDHRAIVELLRGIEPAEAPTDLAAALPLLNRALEEASGERVVAYLLSEFRAGSAPLEATLPRIVSGDASAPVLLAAEAVQRMAPNVQVVSVEPLRGLVLAGGEEGTGQVTVELARCGGELPRDVSRVRLVGEGLPPVEPKTVQWSPGQLAAQVDFVVNLAGRGDGGISLAAAIDDDALAADNTRHTTLLSRNKVRALLLDRRSFGTDPEIDRLRAGQWIQRALQPSDRSPIDVVEVDPAALDTVDVRGADVVVATRPDLLTGRGWDVLRSFVNDGGLLLVTPPGGSNVHPWTTRLTETLGLPWRIDLEVAEPPVPLILANEQPASELMRLISADLADLARPVTVARVLPVDPQQARGATIVAFADGSPLVIAGSPRASDDFGDTPGGQGLVVYLATSLDLGWTNLPAQPLMVPLVHELLKQGIGLIRTSQRYSVGEQPALGLGAAAASLQDPRGQTIAINATGLPEVALGRSGLYGVFDHGKQRIGSVAVNIDTAAGRTDPQDPAAVTEWLGKSGGWVTFDSDDPAAALRTAESGAPLAALLLMAVLALIVIETALARWFSHAHRLGAAGGITVSDEMAEAAAMAPHGH